MKTRRGVWGVLIVARGIGAGGLASAQSPQPTGVSSAQVAEVGAIVTAARVEAALEPIADKTIPVFSLNPPSLPGTYWMLQTDTPPLPFNPFPALTVYPLDADQFGPVFLVDDRSVDYPGLRAWWALEAWAQQFLQGDAGGGLSLMSEEEGPPTPPGAGGGGGTNGPSYLPPAYSYGSNDLWLEITGVTNELAYLTLHGTETSAYYDIQSTTDVGAPGWVLERMLSGDEGETLIRPGIDTRGEPALFFRAGTQEAHTVSIAPDNYLPFAVEPASAQGEPVQVGGFRVSRTDAPATDLTVYYQASGTAVGGVDYTNLTGAVTIPAYLSHAMIFIHPLYDGAIEFEEPVIVTLIPTNGYVVNGAQRSALITINDSTSNPFVVVATNMNTPVGLDYHPTNQSLLVSTNYYGYGLNFARIDAAGYVTNWSTVAGLTEEIKFTTVKATTNGWVQGEMYFGNGAPGGIGRLYADGTLATTNWATLTNETDYLRGSLHIDHTGVWGGDMIVVTGDESILTGTRGVWRVSTNGTSRQIARLTTSHLEGVITLPDDVETWGPWAGKIITGDESSRDPMGTLKPLIYAIDTNGVVEASALAIEPEDFDIIPPNQDLYCNDPFGGPASAGAIVKLSRSLLTNYVGALVITQAGEMAPHYAGKLWIVQWDSSKGSFISRSITYRRPDYSSGRFEHVSFAPVDLPPLTD